MNRKDDESAPPCKGDRFSVKGGVDKDELEALDEINSVVFGIE